MSARMARFESLYDQLKGVQRERAYRPLSKGEDGWVAYEKLYMWGAVNRMRSILKNLPPVPFSDIERVEQMAAGHSDYTKKFALYCSELVDQGA